MNNKRRYILPNFIEKNNKKFALLQKGNYMKICVKLSRKLWSVHWWINIYHISNVKHLGRPFLRWEACYCLGIHCSTPFVLMESEVLGTSMSMFDLRWPLQTSTLIRTENVPVFTVELMKFHNELSHSTSN